MSPGMVSFEAHTLTFILSSFDSVCMTLFFLFFCILIAAFYKEKILIGLGFIPINWISINHDFKNHILNWGYGSTGRIFASHAQGLGFNIQHHIK